MVVDMHCWSNDRWLFHQGRAWKFGGTVSVNVGWGLAGSLTIDKFYDHQLYCLTYRSHDGIWQCRGSLLDDTFPQKNNLGLIRLYMRMKLDPDLFSR